jgi:pimeloyl-ACP methyl ester carboxylesterase
MIGLEAGMLLRALVLLAAVAPSGDGVPIHYTVAGKGEPALVFVHCWNCDRHFWDPQLPAFRKSHRVVAIDLAGHGDSGQGRKDWTIEAFGGDVKAVVDTLGLKRVVLVGSSMGGPVSLEAARKLGDRVVGIVAVDTLQDVEQKAPREQVDKVLQDMKSDYKGQTTQFISGNLFSPTTPPAVRKRVLTAATSASPERSVAMLRAAMLYDPVPALGEIRAPIFAINSDKYPTNIEGNRRHIPQFDVALMKGAGHYLMLEDPPRFNALLADALPRFEKPREPAPSGTSSAGVFPPPSSRPRYPGASGASLRSSPR